MKANTLTHRWEVTLGSFNRWSDESAEHALSIAYPPLDWKLIKPQFDEQYGKESNRGEFEVVVHLPDAGLPDSYIYFRAVPV